MTDIDIKDLRIDKTSFVKRRRYRGVVLILLVMLAVVAIVWYYFREGSIARVEVALVALMYPSESVTVLNASGYVTAQRRASVSSKITGRLVDIRVEEGSRIKKGDVLARLEGEDALMARDQAAANLQVARDELRQVSAELEEAEANFKRYKKLLESEYISRSQYDSALMQYKRVQAAEQAASARIKATEAALAAAGVSVDYSVIRAPFDGVVLTKNADIGDIVTPLGAAANVKAAVVTIADLGTLAIEVDVSESNIGKVMVGQPCELLLDALSDKRFRGSVHMIVPTADRTKGAITVKVNFDEHDQRVLPEMSAKVAFLSRVITDDDKRPRTVLGTGAILNKAGRQVVFLIRDDVVVQTVIKTGAVFGERVEVLEGLKVGDKVVARDLAQLRNGQRIRLKEK
ncbi:secretion protein HlyD family protein [Candidatus Magnetobacterium bavaricum]|uniref:Secretion protein HlyD family protein n=1 Tax=Candidatus Magnetobacterium bavaricum TaxID=29290 RepID=A0A0F3GSC9_9BACT|nr:secretion protein HlyD family protein [Candidatus Magnetobacterium bavaricum]